ncbi:2-succinyl-5-enolpyruvyl-6-hydroxy-3-cyclohexene-1-carboxylic-acid synthase [Mesobacillus maritimus]|uniref:2-succinyl-5-enolpyruvyl-6-hydroxy-3- cyclohexene-1-carboxylic-acid synthase n=1 Tax=Mesobacillus maritimus TaxID=1643336 RepID=UPI00203D9D83|nr:2-succinyl-5-enolpyruvyl-6-hydroxy-3-cyclohexene-1-carboxylic-acid synthase [Mesobacillus maritimus]MCM3587988.1 2-succinyl-5-enolpyruvyl-6-hydroxy-3-cyclohexene-1-carboxylic-acid synthase [Mesobacillus maritimus]
MNHQQALTDYLAAFVAELAYSGVQDVVISPGSRSTPIALVMAEHPNLNLHVHVDERSAAYFALGIAKAKQNPVAILCTSGTAAANYYPAIVEAKISRVPLVVLTADRPHELRDVGAPQAIDQIHLYGRQVKWFAEMSPPDHKEEMIRYARMVCARAAATAIQHPAGPVHLNFPLREPLIPDLHENLFELTHRKEGYVRIEEARLSLSEDQFENLAALLTSKRKGLIVCGPIDDTEFAEAVVELGMKLKYPIIADPLSQLRSGPHNQAGIIDGYDTFLRFEDAKEELKPEVIIRFGAMPVSKALTIFMKENREVPMIVVDGGSGWRDPLTAASEMIYCDESVFCQQLGQQLEVNKDASYLQTWTHINQIAKQSLSTIRDVSELSEGKLFHLLTDILPSESTLFVGNSMPIRDLDTFFFNNKKNIKIMGNRGANGIDGIVSTALGAATVAEPLYLVLGDLTFFHDLNGLLAAKLFKLNVTIIVINNNGGGIFSFLPQSEHPKHFELLFGTPLDIEFGPVVEMYGGSYYKVSGWDNFEQKLVHNNNQGLKVLEVSTERDRNLKEHRDLWKYVSREISNVLKSGKNED